jgi:acyl-CoA thioesterase-1
MTSPPVEWSPGSAYHNPPAPYNSSLTRIPFFLDGVAGSSSLNQADSIHLTGEGYRLIVEKVFPALEPLLERNR